MNRRKPSRQRPVFLTTRRMVGFAMALAFVPASLATSLPAAEDAVVPRQFAAKIDARLAELWRSEQVEPAPPTDDAAFLRRVTLDLIGRIPTSAEVRTFVKNPNPDKRRQLVFHLTEGAAFSRQLGLFLRRTWMPQTDVEPHDYLSADADEWIARQLQQQISYDRIVEKLLVATAEQAGNNVRASRQSRIFLRVNEYKPELLAANAARSFLGINLDCAQCHDHPFARWSRDDFWHTAAFFVRSASTTDESPMRLAIAVPESDRQLEPAFLTKETIRWPETRDATTGRRTFAAWTTASGNPYFARNAVNRIWACFFGAGLTEPLDDLVGGQCIDEGLLDPLANAFRDSGYDLKFLIRGIVLSKAYQCSSRSPARRKTAHQERELFARAKVRGLTGEQLYDSLRIAAGLPVLREDVDPLQSLLERQKFAKRFRLDQAGGAERSILQSLTLMNGPLTATLSDPALSPTVVAVAQAPFLGPQDRIESLFLAVLGRQPNKDETALLKPLAGDADGVTDIFWALVNSVEFNTNH